MPRKRATPPKAPRADWRPFPVRLPPEIDDAVRQLAERDVMAPSVNSVIVTLLQEALRARGVLR